MENQWRMAHICSQRIALNLYESLFSKLIHLLFSEAGKDWVNYQLSNQRHISILKQEPALKIKTSLVVSQHKLG